MQNKIISVILLPMEVQNEEPKQSVEQRFLAQACSLSVVLRIGQMNKEEHEGIIRAIGRYEINIEERGKILTLLKQEISHFSSPRSLFEKSALPCSPLYPQNELTEHAAVKPNIQQEFLDKAIRENQTVTLYLLNGQRIKAMIQAYDNFTILLRDNGNQHLYYKHAVTTINR